MSIQHTNQHPQAEVTGRRKRIALAHLSFILAGTVLITASQAFASANANLPQQPANDSSTSASQQPTVAIFRFAVQSEATDTAAPSSQVCAQYTSDANPSASSPAPDKLTVDPKYLDTISNELHKALSKKKMMVMVDPDPSTIPVGSVIVCGRIFKAHKGSAAGRMVGMGLGASRLGAHIVFLSKTERGLTPIDSFDVRVKGRNLFPPGLSSAALQVAVMERRQNLSADARKLAKRVAKKLESDRKRPELAAKGSRGL